MLLAQSTNKHHELRFQPLRAFVVYVALLLACSNLNAQTDPCANPKAFRTGVFITTNKPSSSGSQISNYLIRKFTAESRLRQELVKQLAGTCVVMDIDVFSDPANYPALKGSTLFELFAAPSLRHPETSAVAVSIIINNGPYFEQNIPLVTVPLMIETDSDYAMGAKMAVQSWNRVSENFIKGSSKSK